MSPALTLLPCVDSPEAALAHRTALDIPRAIALARGEEAVRWTDHRSYPGPGGAPVSLAAEVDRALAGRISVPPDQPLEPPRPRFERTEVQVAQETSLSAARRWVAEGRRPLVLNFANGVTPGGGFLRGARAQEESLCRSSSLYHTLVGDPMYAAHARRPAADSTGWCILSPEVPVFRDDEGRTLAAPWPMSVLTCAAPYAPTVGQPASRLAMSGRIPRILDVAAAHGFSDLVLGAWGCGAFANDPVHVATTFREALERRAGWYDRVVFAISDWSAERRFLGPFRDAFRRAG